MSSYLSYFRLGYRLLFNATAFAALGHCASAAKTFASDAEFYDGTVELDKIEVRTDGEQPYHIARIRSATKTDTPLQDVPQAITVVSRDLIDDQAMRGMADVIRYVPGVGIAQGEGNRDTPVLRGNSSTASFFLDGIRDDVEYFRDLYNVDRVEALKGPNAMIFGRGGAGGLINRVTKQPLSVPVREISATLGAWEQYRATFDLGQPLSHRLSSRLNAVYEDSGSYRDEVTLRRYGLNPTLAFQLAPRTRLVAGFEYFHDERTADRGVPSYQGRPLHTRNSTFFGDPAQSQTFATARIATATLDHDFGQGLTLRNSSRFASYSKFYQNIFPGAVNPSGITVSLSAYNNHTDRENLFNQTDLVLTTDTGSIQHTLLAGLELGRQETDNLRLTGYFTTISPTTTSVSVPVITPRTTLPVTFLPSATDANNHGVATTIATYVQDQIGLLPQLQTVLGARVEDFSIDFRNNRTGVVTEQRDRLLSPRAGLVWKPRAAVSIYASYSMTNIPRAGEQLASLSPTNRAFDPEQFENCELGLKWEPRPSFFLTAALYQLDRRNVVVADPADATRSILVDGQRTEGVELGFSGKVTARWNLTGGYAYQDGKILATQSATALSGARLAQLPRHSASFWQRYDLSSTWGFGLGCVHRGEIFAATDNAVRLPGFTRLDAAIFFKLNARFRAQLNIENLLDRDYAASAHNNNNITPGSPFAVRGSLTAKF